MNAQVLTGDGRIVFASRPATWKLPFTLARRDVLAAGICAVLVFALYWPSLGYGFVNWDDPWYVIENPAIRSWHPANLWRMATEIAIKNYAPLTTFSFLVDYTLFGLRPGGFHLTNMLLHALNAVLVYALLKQVTGSRFVAWTTAALFAVHPIQIESVVWISSRKGLLSASFVLASLICWLRPDRQPRHEGYGILFLVGALLSKAIAIVVPPIALTYDVLVRRHSFSSALARQVVPGLLSILLLLATMTAQSTEIGGVRSHMELSKLHILAVDAEIVWQYVGMLIVPANLCVLYDPPTSGIAGRIAVSIAGWLIVAALAIRFRRRFPLAVTAVVAFFLFLFPVLNFFPITTLMNDRYLYLPSIAFFGLCAGVVQWIVMRGVKAARREPRPPSLAFRQFLAFSAVAVVLCGYARATAAHLPVWRNGMSLWSHAVERVPQLPVVQIQMANSLHEAGDDTQAAAVLEAVLATGRPDELDRKRIEQKLNDWRR